MNESLTFLRALADACRPGPPEFTLFLVAADHFEAIGEGNDILMARALRWMVEHQKYPLWVEAKDPQTLAEQWNHLHGYWVWFTSHSAGELTPCHATIRDSLIWWGMECANDSTSTADPSARRKTRYYAWTAATLDLAEHLPDTTP